MSHQAQQSCPVHAIPTRPPTGLQTTSPSPEAWAPTLSLAAPPLLMMSEWRVKLWEVLTPNPPPEKGWDLPHTKHSLMPHAVALPASGCFLGQKE